MTGLGALVRLVLRRDRVLLPVWVLLTAALPAFSAVATAAAYPTDADLASFAAQAAANPGELALRGPVFAPTVGSLTAWTVGSSGAVLLGGVISLLLVLRHTRAEEQAGRRELVGATAVDRRAPLLAALLVVGSGNALIGVLTTLGLLACGLPAAGSVALGLVFVAGGALFAAVGALVAQLVEGVGAARGLGLAVLGAAFAVSAVGELSRSWLVWASPFGWARRVQPFAGERWWVLLLFAGSAGAVVVGAFVLSARRDLGAGLLRPRPGPATGSLRGPLALAWRLHRASVLAWTAGLLLLGALFGTAMASLGTQLDTPAFRELAAAVGGTDPGQAFFRVVLYVLAQVVSGMAIAGALRMRGQETAGLADVLLATPVGRVSWMLGHLVVTAAGAALALVGLGLGAGLGYGGAAAVLGSTLAYLPACLLFAALAVALVGWAPRAAAPVSWGLLGATLVLDLLGEFRLVDAAVLRASPFVRTAEPLTTGDGLAVALLVIAAAAVGLAALGLAGLRRRDLAVG